MVLIPFIVIFLKFKWGRSIKKIYLKAEIDLNYIKKIF